MRLCSLQPAFRTSMLCKERSSLHLLLCPAESSNMCMHALHRKCCTISVQEVEASHVLIMRLCSLPPTFSTSMLCKERNTPALRSRNHTLNVVAKHVHGTDGIVLMCVECILSYVCILALMGKKYHFSATLNTFLLAPSSAGRGGRTISGKQRIGFGAAAGAQQLYSNITQARSGTATPLNSKAHITARGTFDGWVCSFRGNPVNSKHTASAHTGTPGRHWPRREWGWMETIL